MVLARTAKKGLQRQSDPLAAALQAPTRMALLLHAWHDSRMQGHVPQVKPVSPHLARAESLRFHGSSTGCTTAADTHATPSPDNTALAFQLFSVALLLLLLLMIPCS